MLQNMLIQVLNLIKSMFSFLINRTLGRITLIASVIAIFQSLGLLTPLITNISNFIIGLGGSATNDGGYGMLKALGLKGFDSEGKELEEFGLDLYD